MSGQKTHVREQTNERRYFTMIPNIVLESGLSPIALALYVHLKRRAGDGGVIEDGCRALAAMTGISKSALAEARGELADRQLIEIDVQSANPNAPQVIIVLDIWERNAHHFASCPPNGHVHNTDTSCPPNGQACPPNGRATYSTKNNNKNREEEETRSRAPAPLPPDFDRLAFEAGIQNQPPPPRRPRRSPTNITASDDTRIAAYLELCRPEITPSNAEIIVQRIKPDWTPYWRETCRDYALNQWNVNRIGDMAERCERKANAARVRTMPAAPAKTNMRPVLTEAEKERIYAEQNAKLARIYALREAQAAQGVTA